MRILHVIATTDSSDGGPIEGVVSTGAILRSRGHTQELLTLDDPAKLTEAPRLSPVHAFGTAYPDRDDPITRFRRWASYRPQAVRWLKAHVRDYDAVIVNGIWNYSTHVARRVLPGAGVPYFVYTHGMLDPWFRQRYPLKHAVKQILWWFNEGVLLRNAARVVFTCEEERRLARTFWPWRARELVVTYGTAEPPAAAPEQAMAFRAAAPALGSRRFLLYLSRIHEKKGCDLLIDAFARVAAANPDLDLVIAGPDRSRLTPRLKARAERAGIADRIHWPGPLRGDAKWGAFRGAEAFILPSHQENFGIVVAEAMACTTPVLISHRVNIWREVIEGGAGLAAPDTVTGTLALIEDFLALSSAQRQDMGARGRKIFLAKFESEHVADDLIANLERAIADNDRS